MGGTMSNAMNSYMSLCSTEIVNAARLKTYVGNGLSPRGFDVRCKGCDGLEDILPDAPVGGYQLPELDDAPWYDTAVPESKNFAGLMVTSVVISSPYSRNVIQNIGNGGVLGRPKLPSRTITVHGWLIGKTCCSTQYGLRWLTAALGDSPCVRGCTGCQLDFLDCCPNISAEDDCLITHDSGGNVVIYTRPDDDSEYERADDFFRHMNGVGVVSGPEIISCKGNSCGCGCGSLLEVEFVLAASSPYINSTGIAIIEDLVPTSCAETGTTCDITWVQDTDCVDPRCVEEADCTDDPDNPAPPLPPSSLSVVDTGGACFPQQTVKVCAAATQIRKWGTSTLNIDVTAGTDRPLRNLLIQLWQNPDGSPCDDPDIFPDCAAFGTLFVSYIPLGGVLHISGETRQATIVCNGKERNALSNITDVSGAPFAWPDLACSDACLCVTFDCGNISSDTSITVTRINRDL
jgi:hypothetical protein